MHNPSEGDIIGGIMMYNNLYGVGHYGGGLGQGFEGGIGTWAFSPAIFIGLSILGFLFAIWFVISLALKGYALWTAAKRGEKWWFIALLIINTMGIFELLYLLFIAKVSWSSDCKSCGHCKHCCEGSKTCEVDESEERMDRDNEENTKKEAEEVI